VNLQRFGVILLVMVAAVILLSVYVRRHQPPPPGPAATAPASQPATQAVPPASSPATDAATAPAEVAGAGTASAPATQSAPNVWFELPAPRQSAKLGSLDYSRSGYLLQLDVVSSGAALHTLKLSRYFATDADKRLFESHGDQYEQLRQKNPDKYRGPYSLLNPVIDQQNVFLPLATGNLTVLMEGGKPLTWNLANRPWQMEQVQTAPDGKMQSLTLSWTLLREVTDESGKASRQPFLRVCKTYRVTPSDYTVYVGLRVENLSPIPLTVSLEQMGPAGVPREDPRSDLRKAVYGRYNPADAAVQVQRRGLDKKMQLGVPMPIGSSADDRPVVWLGLANKFFASMMYLTPRDPQNLAATEWSARFSIRAAKESPTSAVQVPSVVLTGLALGPGQSSPTAELEVFAGPKKREMFIHAKAAYHRPIYQRLNYLGTIDLGSCFLTPAWLTLGMMWLLQAFATVSLGNYGLAIILLVFVVRLVLHPLVKKSQVSMMHMQKMAPQIQKLREKYADNKEALNREMMQVYKQQGITPIMGCLPMLLQMPIWFALFTALNAAVELRHAGFLPFWITDLANPDVVARWPEQFSIPLLGHALHLLPILLTVAMFLQAKINPQMAGQTAPVTPEQQQQQKMMKWMMPVMMLFFFYSAPSGLNLYIMASTFAGVVEQVVIKRHIQAREAAAAAVETTVRLPGKAARVARPKKPRGPFWFKRG